ncbi:MAG TPA: CheR family methyltransferase, partial [Candidatus Eisenbacteria bacterium]
VIPPNVNMAIAGGILILTPRPKDRGPHLPVDYWFRSLAEDQKGRAIGVVLSGTGSDGTLGLCEIKAVGGITFAQDESTARHAGMPQSAIHSGSVDFVLSPEAIASRLKEIGQHPYLAPVSMDDRTPEDTDHQFKRILGAIRASTGVDFSLYRDTTIKRRIMRRMALHRLKTWEEYRQFLQDTPAEIEDLYHDLLINVTSFFRDAEMFEALKVHVFPEITREKSPSTPIRMWVPGCSTGQEAYSLAMSLLEYYDDKPITPAIQIFATDLSDQKSLDRARAGVYPESIEAVVSPERLRRFFRREDHVYRINKNIRDSCVFARQNVTSDPPFSHLDIISCRNVLIYLSTPLQKRVLPTFHYALNAPGYLLLGTAETVGENADLFELVDRSHKIYAKKGTAARLPLHYATEGMRGVDMPNTRRFGPLNQVPSDFQREADRMLLGRYAPAGVLINENLDILQFRGRTSAYLEPAPGEPTTNVLKMAREGLFMELRSALTEARKHQRAVRREKVRITADGQAHDVTVEVVPIKPPGAAEGCFLILFHDGEREGARGPSTVPQDKASPGREMPDDGDAASLRQELAATKEYLQSLAEQQDAANEELRSANEEILSSNEELQSTNEELETAKEELQSANEELTTVNEQLQHRNHELSRLNNDLTNLMASTHIPVVMVSSDLRIRSFTGPARKIMSLLPTDVGRP